MTGDGVADAVEVYRKTAAVPCDCLHESPNNVLPDLILPETPTPMRISCIDGKLKIMFHH